MKKWICDTFDKNPSLLGAACFGAGVLASVALRRAIRYKKPRVWKHKPMGGTWGKLNKPTAGPQKDGILPRGKHPVQLYSLSTPNGVKVSIMLEELGIEYDAYTISIGKGDQFTSGFCKANPNSKIPALLHYTQAADGKAPAEGEPIRVFESGSILLYLQRTFDKESKFMPKDERARAECMSWLMWQMGSAPYLGGGFGHFYNYAPYDMEYPINRFSMEAKRQLDVLNRRLGGLDGGNGGPYLCGDQYTIADMAIYPWYGKLVLGSLYGAKDFLQVDEYKFVKEWAQRIAARPAVERGDMVNRTWGPERRQLRERHDKSDFENKTWDKVKPKTEKKE